MRVTGPTGWGDTFTCTVCIAGRSRLTAAPRGSHARVPAGGLVAGLLALPVPGPERLYCWHEDEAGSGENAGAGGGHREPGAGRMRLWRRACPGRGRRCVTTRRQRAWPGDDGRRIWAWRWVSLRHANLHGAARSAREHGHRDACRYGDDPDDGRYRPAGSAHDAAGGTGHRARREGEPDRPEQGMAHPRASDLAARRGRPSRRGSPGRTARSMRKEAWARHLPAAVLARAKASGRAR